MDAAALSVCEEKLVTKFRGRISSPLRNKFFPSLVCFGMCNIPPLLGLSSEAHTKVSHFLSHFNYKLNLMILGENRDDDVEEMGNLVE